MKIKYNDILSILFWGNFAAFCIHVLDETLMAGGFVAGVQTHFWPTYNGIRFFGTNTFFVIIIAASNVLYDWKGERFIILPIIWVWERTLNGIWHIGWTIYFKEYSPGLVTSCLFFMIFYLLFRYGVQKGNIKYKIFWIGGIIATVLEVLLLSTLWWVQRII